MTVDNDIRWAAGPLWGGARLASRFMPQPPQPFELSDPQSFAISPITKTRLLQ